MYVRVRPIGGGGLPNCKGAVPFHVSSLAFSAARQSCGPSRHHNSALFATPRPRASVLDLIDYDIFEAELADGGRVRLSP